MCGTLRTLWKTTEQGVHLDGTSCRLLVGSGCSLAAFRAAAKKAPPKGDEWALSRDSLPSCFGLGEADWAPMTPGSEGAGERLTGREKHQGW